MGVDDKGISTKFPPLLILMFLVVCGGAERIMCIEKEREALLTIKQSLVDDYGFLSMWGSEDCCFWNFVECNRSTGHVAALRFRGVRGEISSALLDLHHLVEMSFNGFGGKRIPEFIGSIKTLQNLDLSNSNSSGIIPPQLGNLTNLHTLNLRGNHLWSHSLDWLPHLSLLTYLDLSNSNISDANWLQHVLRLPSLQELHLENSTLTDATPQSANSSSTSLSILSLSDSDLTSSNFRTFLNISTSLVYIDVSRCELSGPIPDDFGNLIHLEHLVLHGNMLEGGIPKSFGNLIRLERLDVSGNRLGESLEESVRNLSCKAMESLDLSDNEFTDSLPDLSKCADLVELRLGGNKLTGSVPANIGHLSNLNYLDLSHNSFQGTISDAHFAKLGGLIILDLSFNSLTLDFSPNWTFPSELLEIRLASCRTGPSFPAWLQSQKIFSWLDISDNGISDVLPEWFWNFYPLVGTLNISHNQISGTIPDLSSLLISRIDVSYNKFSGPLPLLHPETLFAQLSRNRFAGSNISSSVCTYWFVMLIDLSNNQLSGALPDCWDKMPNLLVVNMNNNHFSSEIPPSLGSLQNLKTLHLGRNNLFGDLPSTLKNCQSLQLIDIGGNRLRGNITSWLGEEYVNMTYLSLRGNRFYGGIPREICKFTRIQMLDLSGNNISGKIPQCLGNFTSLVDKNSATATTIRIQFFDGDYVDYALVQWKGVEAEYKNTLGLLKLIDLSSNKLVGSIPKAFSNLRGLISLNLSGNQLTGSMDPNIGDMEMLECLDLSRNQLSGGIPTGLARLHFLSVLDLANNDLSGEIPSSTQLQSFDESVFGGNSNLCGKPLHVCPDDPINNAGENIKEESDGFFNLSFLQEFCISMAFGFIIGFWGVVGSLALKKSFRRAYFNVLNSMGDWLYVTTILFVNKFRRS